MKHEIKTSLPIQELAEITKQAPNLEQNASNESWSDAAFTLAWSLGSKGVTFEGWISYYDGKKIKISFETSTQITGTAAGTVSLPWVRVKPWLDIPESGEFTISGFMFAGIITIKGNGTSLFNPKNLITASASWADYSAEGKCKFEK